MPATGKNWCLATAAWLTLVTCTRAEFLPLAIDHGQCEAVLSTPRSDDQFYLVIGSLAEASSRARITVRVDSDPGPEHLSLEPGMADPAWKNRVESQARLLERERRRRHEPDSSVSPLTSPPPVKVFHLFTGDRDLENLGNYQAVCADLAGVGRLAQVYLDHDDRDLPGVAVTIAEVLRIFDEDVGPRAEHLGRVQDVDRDGRFTILLTARLSGLQNGKVQVDGFVRGSDFFRDLPAPFSNHCDMLYLNAALKPGPHLRTVLAHEFSHAVTFCEHALTPYGERPTNQDEESWLNEGLAHLIENPREFGWSNLDYRISAFLSGPEQCPLVVGDYFNAGLWRHPATRGAAFLFLSSCREHADGEFTRRLVQSPLRGIANLEAATQKPFAELFRQATVDFLQSSNYGRLENGRKGPLLCGPRYHEIPLSGGRGECIVAGTAAAFFLLHSPAGSHARLQVAGAGPLQVTLVRVPAGLPRLSARWVVENGRLRIVLTAHYGPVWLRDASWDDPRVTAEPANCADWFDRERLDEGASVTSAALALPAGADGSKAVFKVLGQDTQGRPMATWLPTKAE